MSWRAFAGQNVKRVFVFCDPTKVGPGQSSNGVLKWVNKNYTSLKSLNPNLPLAVRGVKGTPAVINVQYAHDQEKYFNVENQEPSEIDKVMETAVLMGEYAKRDRMEHTKIPFDLVNP